MENKKSLSLIIFMLLLGCGYTPLNAQLLSLDSYLIPLNVKGAKIGSFITVHPEKISLTKDESDLFTVDSHGSLFLHKDKEVQGGDKFSYEITVKYGNDEYRFELVKDEFLHNKVVAHRGAWKHYDVSQNSLGALNKAIELGCEASEFDVWLSKDKRVVINHDHEINGLKVEETDLVEIQKNTLKSGELMPTLEQYIEYVKTQNKTRLVLELKSDKKHDRVLELTDSVVNIVHRMKAQAWIEYISFDYRALQSVKYLDAGARTSYLDHDRPMDLQKVEGMTGIDYHFSVFDKIERLYDRARVLGLTINAWTVNDEKQMTNFLNMGIDLITTDEPEMLLHLTKSAKRSCQ